LLQFGLRFSKQAFLPYFGFLVRTPICGFSRKYLLTGTITSHSFRFIGKISILIEGGDLAKTPVPIIAVDSSVRHEGIYGITIPFMVLGDSFSQREYSRAFFCSYHFLPISRTINSVWKLVTFGICLFENRMLFACECQVSQQHEDCLPLPTCHLNTAITLLHESELKTLNFQNIQSMIASSPRSLDTRAFWSPPGQMPSHSFLEGSFSCEVKITPLKSQKFVLFLRS